MNELSIFKNEEFGEIRTLSKNGNPWFCLSDLCKTLELSNPSQVKTRLKSDGLISNEVIDSIGRKQNAIFVNESNFYKTVFQSKKKEAEKFVDWVTSEVIPSIRKNGGYIANQENLSSEEILARAVLVAQNVIKEKDRLISEQKKEIEYKEDVIVGLVEDIDLTTKRQRITQIVRKSGSNYSDRYAMMYKEFEMKYHMDLSRRLESDTYKNIKPKIKSKMDLIDRGLNMIPQLYEICCKLFENDVKVLMKEWENNI